MPKKDKSPNDILTKSFFLEVMSAIQKQLDFQSEKLKEHDKRFEKIEAKLEEHDKRFEKIEAKLESHEIILERYEDNFQRIYDAIETLDIRITKLDEKLEDYLTQLRHEINIHFDAIYKKLEQYDDEWACINAWISRQEEKNKFFEKNLLTVRLRSPIVESGNK